MITAERRSPEAQLRRENALICPGVGKRNRQHEDWGEEISSAPWPGLSHYAPAKSDVKGNRDLQLNRAGSEPRQNRGWIVTTSAMSVHARLRAVAAMCETNPNYGSPVCARELLGGRTLRSHSSNRQQSLDMWARSVSPDPHGAESVCSSPC